MRHHLEVALERGAHVHQIKVHRIQLTELLVQCVTHKAEGVRKVPVVVHDNQIPRRRVVFPVLEHELVSLVLVSAVLWRQKGDTFLVRQGLGGRSTCRTWVCS